MSLVGDLRVKPTSGLQDSGRPSARTNGLPDNPQSSRKVLVTVIIYLTRILTLLISRLALVTVALAWAWVVIPHNPVAVVFYGLVGALVMPVVPRFAIAVCAWLDS